VQDGDLGENVLVDDVDFSFFQIGQRYSFVETDKDGRNDDNEGSVVVVEITEPMEPCANLCKLPYINDENKSPKERIAACQAMLSVLNQQPGLRGWYAKVLQTGTIKKHCRITKFPL
jgi:MOSC domain-containing protein YiiM